jgi:hypothetical protein
MDKKLMDRWLMQAIKTELDYRGIVKSDLQIKELRDYLLNLALGGECSSLPDDSESIDIFDNFIALISEVDDGEAVKYYDRYFETSENSSLMFCDNANDIEEHYHTAVLYHLLPIYLKGYYDGVGNS